MLGRSAVRAVQRTRFSTFALCVLLLFGFTSAGCGSFPGVNGIRIVDLKISGEGPYGWVDNDTFVTKLPTGESYTRTDGKSVPVTRVATINYRTGERKYFGRATSDVCFSRGYVSYFFLNQSTGELLAFYGDLGKEKIYSVGPEGLTIDRGPRGSCRPWGERPRRPEWLSNDSAFWPLSPYLGFLSCGVRAATLDTSSVTARFHRPGDEIGLKLPFSCYEVSNSLKYYEFSGAYFGLEFDYRSPYPNKRTRRVFWLHPDGRVETHVLPQSEVVRHAVIPTAKGYLAISRPTTRDGTYEIYLVTPQGVTPVVPGDGVAVTSPDGCKVAILHDPQRTARRFRDRPATKTLKVLELCR